MVAVNISAGKKLSAIFTSLYSSSAKSPTRCQGRESDLVHSMRKGWRDNHVAEPHPKCVSIPSAKFNTNSHETDNSVRTSLCSFSIKVSDLVKTKG
jgi:hypothetical protein